MNCSKCGNVLAPGSTICSACGTPVSNQNMQSMNVNNQPASNDDVLVFGAPQVQPLQPEVQVAPVQTIAPAQPAPTPVQPAAPMNAAPVQPMPAPAPVQSIDAQPAPTPVQPAAPMNGGMQMGQPNMYAQQPMPSAYPEAQPNYGNPMPQQKKSNGAFYAILGVLAVAIVGVVVYMLFFTGDKNTGGTTPSGNNSENSGGNNSENPGGNVASNSIKVGNYTFSVPSGYTNQKFETDDGEEYNAVVDKTNKIIAVVTIIEGYSYDEIADAKDEFLGEEGILAVTEETYGGRKWVVLSFVVEDDGETLKGKKLFTSIDSSNSVAFEVYNMGTKSDSQVYTDLGKMADSAKYDGVAGFVGSKKPIKTNDINIGVIKKQYPGMINGEAIDVDLPDDSIDEELPGTPIDETIPEAVE